jgi:hypothetical protein
MRFTMFVGVTALMVGCVRGGFGGGASSDVATEGEADVPLADLSDRGVADGVDDGASLGTFSAPTRIASLAVESEADDNTPSFTSDLRELYFQSRGRPPALSSVIHGERRAW